MNRLWSMLTDFSGDEGPENLMCCFGLLLIIGVAIGGFALWRLAERLL